MLGHGESRNPVASGSLRRSHPSEALQNAGPRTKGSIFVRIIIEDRDLVAVDAVWRELVSSDFPVKPGKYREFSWDHPIMA